MDHAACLIEACCSAGCWDELAGVDCAAGVDSDGAAGVRVAEPGGPWRWQGGCWMLKLRYHGCWSSQQGGMHRMSIALMPAEIARLSQLEALVSLG